MERRNQRRIARACASWRELARARPLQHGAHDADGEDQHHPQMVIERRGFKGSERGQRHGDCAGDPCARKEPAGRKAKRVAPEQVRERACEQDCPPLVDHVQRAEQRAVDHQLPGAVHRCCERRDRVAGSGQCEERGRQLLRSWAPDEHAEHHGDKGTGPLQPEGPRQLGKTSVLPVERLLGSICEPHSKRARFARSSEIAEIGHQGVIGVPVRDHVRFLDGELGTRWQGCFAPLERRHDMPGIVDGGDERAFGRGEANTGRRQPKGGHEGGEADREGNEDAGDDAQAKMEHGGLQGERPMLPF